MAFSPQIPKYFSKTALGEILSVVASGLLNIFLNKVHMLEGLIKDLADKGTYAHPLKKLVWSATS